EPLRWIFESEQRSVACRLRGLRYLDDLAFYSDLDLVADDEPAVENRVEGQAEVLAVYLSLGTVSDPVAHHAGVAELAIPDHLQRDRAGIVLDRQITSQRVLFTAGRHNAWALERHHRVFLDFEEVRGPDVVVPHPVVGTDAGGGDRGLNRRRLRVGRIDFRCGADFVKVATNRHHA